MTTRSRLLSDSIVVAAVTHDSSTSPPKSSTSTTSTTPIYPIYAAYPPYPTDGEMSQPSGVHVRAEEIGLVLLALILWAGAVALFFNRWGKIRMLEPYQPKFIDTPARSSVVNGGISLSTTSSTVLSARRIQPVERAPLASERVGVVGSPLQRGFRLNQRTSSGSFRVDTRWIQCRIFFFPDKW